MQYSSVSTVDEFTEQADPYRVELLAHCYRMLGSIHDAEDLVQETYLRAWRSYEGFEGRSSLRTWLYRIATRVCLTALEGRDRRPLPSGLAGPTDDPEGQLSREPAEVTWLEPFPDTLFGTQPVDPAAVVTFRESTRLALVAALQYLSPRQRAVLILRDVLRWSAAEVAEALETTTAAVNSSLQRARVRLRELSPDDVVEPDDVEQRELLDRYAAAFENADIASLKELLTEDVVWEMPPVPNWFTGRDAIGQLVVAQCPAGPGDRVMIPVRANGQPGFGFYRRSGDAYVGYAVQVLTVTKAGISKVVAFHDRSLFALFGLPEAKAVRR
jgi:RNA polymerase sigma-70 factor, ECF subfamily